MRKASHHRFGRIIHSSVIWAFGMQALEIQTMPKYKYQRKDALKIASISHIEMTCYFLLQKSSKNEVKRLQQSKNQTFILGSAYTLQQAPY